MERRGKQGLYLILGVTKETIERNVLEPMRDFWGARLVGGINSRNIARLFGEKVYCLGAEKVSQVTKLRGAKFKYAYCDEIVEYNREVFELLKSRLSLEYSVCDFTGNPSHPSHFMKEFIESEADVYCQSWTIFDNPFLSDRVVSELVKEYSGSVYYDRYIMGLWKRAEGVIYRLFADNPERYSADEVPPLIEINIGMDFGGTKSKHTLVATGVTPGYKKLIALMSERMDADGTTPADIERFAVEFTGKVIRRFGRCDYLYWDSAEQVLGRGVKEAVEKAYPQVSVRPCFKAEINERISLTARLLGMNMFSYTKDCKTLKSALEEAVWDENREDTRLDDGTTDVDTLDAFEYSFSRNMNRFIF